MRCLASSDVRDQRGAVGRRPPLWKGSPVTTQPAPVPHARRLRRIGTLTALIGVMLLVVGVATVVMVRTQLASENIVLHDDAPILAGTVVDNPLSAYLQAEVIEGHAAGIAGGATFAELDRDDPRRASLAEASFVRASLMTSVIAFGLAAFSAGLGLVLALVGWALRGLGAPATARETTEDPAPIAQPVPA